MEFFNKIKSKLNEIKSKLSRNVKNVIKWVIAVLGTSGVAFGIIQLVPDPQNPDRELLLPLGWTIAIMVVSAAVLAWYAYRVMFTEN